MPKMTTIRNDFFEKSKVTFLFYLPGPRTVNIGIQTSPRVPNAKMPRPRIFVDETEEEDDDISTDPDLILSDGEDDCR